VGIAKSAATSTSIVLYHSRLPGLATGRIVSLPHWAQQVFFMPITRKNTFANMPNSAYPPVMRKPRSLARRPLLEDTSKPLVWLHGEIKTPPMSREARIEAGFLLRRAQEGEHLSMPESRPMPSIGQGSHELRITDVEHRIEWRVVYCVGKLAIAVLEVFEKKTKQTPQATITNCRRRYAAFKKEDTP
jgi:phage-related protein